MSNIVFNSGTQEDVALKLFEILRFTIAAKADSPEYREHAFQLYKECLSTVKGSRVAATTAKVTGI